jgi:hypothetical protein
MDSLLATRHHSPSQLTAHSQFGLHDLRLGLHSTMLLARLHHGIRDYSSVSRHQSLLTCITTSQLARLHLKFRSLTLCALGSNARRLHSRLTRSASTLSTQLLGVRILGSHARHLHVRLTAVHDSSPLFSLPEPVGSALVTS